MLADSRGRLRQPSIAPTADPAAALAVTAHLLEKALLRGYRCLDAPHGAPPSSPAVVVDAATAATAATAAAAAITYATSSGLPKVVQYPATSGNAEPQRGHDGCPPLQCSRSTVVSPYTHS